MFTGKGGVGKTSLAAATGIKLAAGHYRTLVMSIDPAHSLGDSFDLETDLFHLQTSDPLQVSDRLWIQELNIQKEIKRHWAHERHAPVPRDCRHRPPVPGNFAGCATALGQLTRRVS